ncbi:YcnI family protein [Paenibacillus tengchongensis]|uniref:YcnI family copper-binding membrane protein n=1 Tax=Paenibacillus tengchongensis TaxID=2608684 RepID=UPI00124C87C1|nr:DUF1775 domain-containing protein [Paenibacillus tengchongensis]
MMKMLRKIITMTVPLTAAFMLFAAVASAHVTVAPAESATGAWETYTLKVPSEKDIATVQVDLRIPEGAAFKQFEPTPGWEVTVEGNKVSWKATGEGILAGQFQRFYFTAQNPAEASEIAWDAYQHYADGSKVEWSGEEGSETPHSVTAIIEAAGGSGGHSHGSSGTSGSDTMTMDEHNQIMAEQGDGESAKISPLVYIALGISLLAFLLSVVGVLRGRKE